ncbi:hypothetical protein ATCC90586_003388 [Pythium insidiosum]|nr:hypothetical protein ATCC90586_003388 [Pythium insidiosum]
MALDSALHFLDDLKDKYMHEVEKAIEDWDYQDFSPDKRTPLLENEVSNDVDDDLRPEQNAIYQIKGTPNWAGLSRDDALNDQGYGAAMGVDDSLPFETRVVMMATPNGGVQGIPDTDAIQRFLQQAPSMNPVAVTAAMHQRLEQSVWQIRSKTLVLMEFVLESHDGLLTKYLPAFVGHPTLIQLLDKLRTQDHNQIVRENARKVLSLIRSSGANPMLVAREHVEAKAHVRHTPHEKTKKVEKKPHLAVKTTPAPAPKGVKQQHHYHATSPKVAAAALASWRRRSQMDLNKPNSPRSDAPNLMPFQQPPKSVTMTKGALFRSNDDSNMKAAAPPAPSSPSSKAPVVDSSRYNMPSRTRLPLLRFYAAFPSPTDASRDDGASLGRMEPIPESGLAPHTGTALVETDDAEAAKKARKRVLWLKLNFTVKAAGLQTLKRQKYQHLQEESLLRARGLLQNWDNGFVLLTEDLYRRAAGERDAQELMNYTPEALALRFSLRNDPNVLEAVRRLWHVELPRTAMGCIDQRGYANIFRRIAKSLDAKTFRKRRLDRLLDDDWKRDSKGEPEMSFANFFDSIFELADLWCDTIDASDYVAFLERLCDRISHTRNGKRVLKPMKKVTSYDADSDDDESSEPTSENDGSSSGDDVDRRAARRAAVHEAPGKLLIAKAIAPATSGNRQNKLATHVRPAVARAKAVVPSRTAVPGKRGPLVVVASTTTPVKVAPDSDPAAQRRGSVITTLEFNDDGSIRQPLGHRDSHSLGSITEVTVSIPNVSHALDDDPHTGGNPERHRLSLAAAAAAALAGNRDRERQRSAGATQGLRAERAAAVSTAIASGADDPKGPVRSGGVAGNNHGMAPAILKAAASREQDDLHESPLELGLPNENDHEQAGFAFTPVDDAGTRRQNTRGRLRDAAGAPGGMVRIKTQQLLSFDEVEAAASAAASAALPKGFAALPLQSKAREAPEETRANAGADVIASFPRVEGLPPQIREAREAPPIAAAVAVEGSSLHPTAQHQADMPERNQQELGSRLVPNTAEELSSDDDDTSDPMRIQSLHRSAGNKAPSRVPGRRATTSGATTASSQAHVVSAEAIATPWFTSEDAIQDEVQTIAAHSHSLSSRRSVVETEDTVTSQRRPRRQKIKLYSRLEDNEVGDAMATVINVPPPKPSDAPERTHRLLSVSGLGGTSGSTNTEQLRRLTRQSLALQGRGSVSTPVLATITQLDLDHSLQQAPAAVALSQSSESPEMPPSRPSTINVVIPLPVLEGTRRATTCAAFEPMELRGETSITTTKVSATSPLWLQPRSSVALSPPKERRCTCVRDDTAGAERVRGEHCSPLVKLDKSMIGPPKPTARVDGSDDPSICATCRGTTGRVAGVAESEAATTPQVAKQHLVLQPTPEQSEIEDTPPMRRSEWMRRRDIYTRGKRT